MKSGNLLILQSGISGIVGNSVLYGALSEALNHEEIEGIYGAFRGFEGVLKKDFIDLADLPQKKANQMLCTAGYCLRHESDNFKGTVDDFASIVDVLCEKQICYVLIIGDVTSLNYVDRLNKAAKEKKYDLQILVVPQSNDNDIALTDHSLGYGSALKFINSYLLSFYQLLRSEFINFGVCELDGVTGEWGIAGSSLSASVYGKSSTNPLQYVVCMPYRQFDEQKFVEIIKEKMKRGENVMCVTLSRLNDAVGNPVNISQFNTFGAYVENLIQSKLNVVTCLNNCNLYMQPLSNFISGNDQYEAIKCGIEALKAFLNGESDKAAILVRSEQKNADCEINFVDYKDLLKQVKRLPEKWFAESTMTMTYDMAKYALPLVKDEYIDNKSDGYSWSGLLAKNSLPDLISL